MDGSLGEGNSRQRGEGQCGKKWMGVRTAADRVSEVTGHQSMWGLVAYCGNFGVDLREIWRFCKILREKSVI